MSNRERILGKAEVVSSILTGSTIFRESLRFHAAMRPQR